MNISRILIIGTVVMAGSSSVLADTKAQWQKRFDAYCAQVKKRDANKVEAALRDIFSSDFKFVPSKGEEMNLEDWILGEKAQVAATQRVNAESIHITSFNSSGDVGTIKLSLKFDGIVKLDPKGKAERLKYEAVVEQSVAKRDGKWWVIKMKQISQKTMYNGKPYPTVK